MQHQSTAFFLLAALTLSLATPAQEMRMDHSAMPKMKTATKQINIVTVIPNTAIPATQTQNFTIKVQSAKGMAVSQFDRVHEKLMHFIVVSNDLQSFQHLHPEYEGKGVFTLKATLPAAGAYTAFADYTPQGQDQQKSSIALDAGLAPKVAPVADTNLSKTVAGLKITLMLDPKKIKSGVETPIAFKFQDAQGKPVTDLQPYLGAMGHLVVLRYSPTLTAANYLHAHPQEMMGHMHPKRHKMDGSMAEMKMAGAMKTNQSGTVTFETTFPTQGLYKMWGQFQHGGKIITADFTIRVDS